MTLSGCKEREFRVCQIDDSNEKKWITRQADQDDRKTRLKAIGLEARMSIQLQPEEEPTAKKSKYTLEHFVQCRVVMPQPLLEVDASALVDGRVQVYEGETLDLGATLRNVSSLPADYANFSFSDNLSLTAQAALAEGGLNPSAAHALEWGLVKQPVLRFDGDARELSVPPGESVPVSIKIFGKAGCSSATIELDYGHIKAPGRGGLATEEKTNFFTRKLSLSFPIDVIRVAQPHVLDVRLLQVNDLSALMAGNGVAAAGTTAEETSGLGEALARSADERGESQVCLLSMDVRNVHSHEVELQLKFRRDDDREICFRRAVVPGGVVRLALPIDQLQMTPEEEGKPVPSLSNRQLTIAREKLSPAAEKHALLKFWCKEYLYERLHASWTDLRTGREGEVAIRGQEFTDGQIQALRRPPLSVILHLDQGKVKAGAPDGVDSVRVQAEDFVDLSAKITNRSGESAASSA